MKLFNSALYIVCGSAMIFIEAKYGAWSSFAVGCGSTILMVGILLLIPKREMIGIVAAVLALGFTIIFRPRTVDTTRTAEMTWEITPRDATKEAESLNKGALVSLSFVENPKFHVWVISDELTDYLKSSKKNTVNASFLVTYRRSKVSKYKLTAIDNLRVDFSSTTRPSLWAKIAWGRGEVENPGIFPLEQKVG